MLKVYKYPEEQCWPSSHPRPQGSFNIEGEYVNDPNAADVLVVPYSIFNYEMARINPTGYLKHLKGREDRHVWLEIADCYANHTKQIGDGFLFSCFLNAERQHIHKRAVAIGWPCEDLADCLPVPSEGFSFDVVFQGWGSCAPRRISAESCRRSGLRSHIEIYPEFYGHYESTEKGRSRRTSYKDTLRRSMVALCPNSSPGTFAYRMWETMSAGRIPAAVVDNPVFPFADEIPYRDFCIVIPESKADSAGTIIGEWISKRSVSDIVELGRTARSAWEKWLDPRKWPSIMRIWIERKLGI